MKKLAIVGCGRLANLVADALIGGLLPDYQLVGVFSRSAEKAKSLADKMNDSGSAYNCTPCNTIDQLLALKPDYIVESASPQALRELTLPALKNGTSIVALSIGAFADTDFYEQVQDTAREHNARVYLVSGAIGGLDVLRTASLMGPSTVTFESDRNSAAFRYSSVYDQSLENHERTVFEGNAREAIALFPRMINVAVAASLASVGPANTKVKMNSIPGYIGDEHRIEINNAQVRAVINVYSSTAQIAGWSVVNTLRNITSPIVF